MIGGQTPRTVAGRRARRLVQGTWCILPLVYGAMIGPCVAPAWAQSGTVQNSRGGGVRLTVDTQWPDGAGYRPVRVTATPTVPIVANRTLVFEFTTKSTAWESDEELVVTQEIELPAGSGPVATTIAVPYLVMHDNYEYQVGEDGRAIPGLIGGGTYQTYSIQEDLPRVLIVTDQSAVSNHLGRAFAAPYSEWRSGNDTFYLPTFLTLSVRDLPSRWIDYSALDMVCVSFGDLEGMKLGQPEVFDALLAWTAAGGNLLVFDMGGEEERRASLERLVGMAPSDLGDSGWDSPNPAEFGQRVAGVASDVVAPYDEIPSAEYGMNDGYGMGMESTDPPKKPEKQEKPRPKRAIPSSFASRPYEMGMLVSIASSSPWNEDAGFWAWLCNHLTSSRIIWAQRHGLSIGDGNPEFPRFLIPGVGNPPLNAYRILITLFVLAIGPVNYYVLRHLRRLQLLVVTVPASAAAVTLALFAYAIFSDGLGTRVRVRSVTHINQKTRQTECWARLSYYSGLAPGGGLTFPDDVAIYSFEDGEHVQGSQRRELLWYDGQRMTTGWLRSRTPTQYLTVRSRKSPVGIDVGAVDAGVLPITNRLGTEIELLVVCDAKGELYWANDVMDEGRTEAQPVDGDDASAGLTAKVQACDMSLPPGAVYGYGHLYKRAPGSSTSLMEGIIGEVTAGTASLEALAPGSYVAIVGFSPEVELGVSTRPPEASLHVVVGTW